MVFNTDSMEIVVIVPFEGSLDIDLGTKNYLKALGKRIPSYFCFDREFQGVVFFSFLFRRLKNSRIAPSSTIILLIQSN